MDVTPVAFGVHLACFTDMTFALQLWHLKESFSSFFAPNFQLNPFYMFSALLDYFSLDYFLGGHLLRFYLEEHQQCFHILQVVGLGSGDDVVFFSGSLEMLEV